MTTSSDSGPGSLRQAILDSNATNTLDTVRFQIPGSGPFTINLQSALPPISDPVVLDATTQPGFAGTPMVELNGNSAGVNAGLRILAGNSVVRGLAINRCGSDAIRVEGPGTNWIAGNYIGLDPTGTLGRANQQEGVWLWNSWNNLVGGTNGADRNVIGANKDAGVYIQGAGGNRVLGNLIGLKSSGTSAAGNGNSGVIILNSVANTIGGANAGARNIISGNGSSGIYVNGVSSISNLVQGNYIGTDIFGTAAISNAADGVTIQYGTKNTVGGATAGAGNLISGNGMSGVSLFVWAASNGVAGNRIGTDLTGKAAVPNNYAGITLDRATNNVIGGLDQSARNLVSGNKQDGIYFASNSFGNIVIGNIIGLDADGTNPVRNLYNGISIRSAYSNIVGGASMEARNVISGNTFEGVAFYDQARGNRLEGNLIGTDLSGAVAKANLRNGVKVDSSPGNWVGGSVPGTGNLISGNGIFGDDQDGAGVVLIGTNCANNVVQGNKLGTDLTGTTAIPNGKEGVYIQGAMNNLIGGSAPGAGNLISGNATYGIFINPGAGNVIQGNLLGTKADGVSELRNGDTFSGFHVIELSGGSVSNVIGSRVGLGGNRIAFAPYRGSVYFAGVRVRPGAIRNAINGNAIFSNGGLGIDLDAYQMSPNDACDGDTGANTLQNFPVLSHAFTGGSTLVEGTLNAKANTACVLEFFANPSCDAPQAFGEGMVYLGETTVTTSASCTASFSVTLPVSLPEGYVITASATDNLQNTSEFCACIAVTALPPLTYSLVDEGQSALLLSWTNWPAGLILKQTASLAAPITWTPVPAPAPVNGMVSVSIPVVSNDQQFFRLFLE